MLELKMIDHQFGSEELILSGINLNLHEGECVGLVGPSGCGKTTLANIISGHIKPTSGDVLFCKQNITRKPNRKVIKLSQESDLFPWQTVWKSLAFAMKENHQKDKIVDLLGLTRLTGYESYFPHQLSGGMRKRLSLARALAIEPKVLVLDEAFSYLDSELKNDIYSDLRLIWEKSRMTILLITHDLSDIKSLAQRVVKLSKNKPTTICSIENI